MNWLKLRNTCIVALDLTYIDAWYLDQLIAGGDGCLADAIERDRLYRHMDALQRVINQIDIVLAYEDMGPNV